jgi:hypothetical protein
VDENGGRRRRRNGEGTIDTITDHHASPIICLREGENVIESLLYWIFV